MNKLKINYVVDFLAFISFVITALTGLALKIFLPSGVRQGRLQEFIETPKVTWLEIHDWAGILLVVLVIIHLILHWDWIVCMTKNVFKLDTCEIKKDDNKVDNY
jgi:cytochrome b subunit of formate dehydrogenase